MSLLVTAGAVGHASAHAASSSTSSQASSSQGVALLSVSALHTPLVGVSISNPSSSSPPLISVSLPGSSPEAPLVKVNLPSTPVASSPPPPSSESPSGANPSESPPADSSTTSTESPPTRAADGSSGGSATTPTQDPTASSAQNGITSTTTPKGVDTHVDTHSDSSPSQHSSSPGSSATHKPRQRSFSPRVNRRGSEGVTTEQAATFTSSHEGSSPAGRAHHPSRTSKRSGGNSLDTLGRQIPLPIPVPDWSKPIILLLVLLAIGLGARSRLAVHRARRLESRHVALLQDMNVMQTALVPAVPARLEGLAVSVAYQPADGPAAGGDFYDLFIPQPGKVAIILGDVSGHGRDALSHAALTRYTLRAYLHAGLEPRTALALAGRVLADPAVEHYATVALGIYDTQHSQLTYALAGHPPPLLRGVSAPEPPTICSSPPIGWGMPTGRRQSVISLPTGAEVCFFSDGLTEARAKDELLGRERLGEILGELGPRAAATDLLARVQAAAERTPDDMAACILISEAQSDIQSIHVEELEVDARALAGDSVRRFLEICHLPASEIDQTIDSAASIATTGRTALLRVALQPNGPVVTVRSTELDSSQSAFRERHGHRERSAGNNSRSAHETNGPCVSAPIWTSATSVKPASM
jgi:hypothetical protein